jgi:hypothetical protein
MHTAGEEVHLSACCRAKVPKDDPARDEDGYVKLVEFPAGFLFEPLII